MSDWLAETRRSYDTVAVSYAVQVRELLDSKPYATGVLRLFAGLVEAGPVVDAGCGPGQVTAYLRSLGVDAFGIDLSPSMIAEARGAFPGVRFEVGSMTELDLADDSVAGVLAWWSLVHVPDSAMAGVFAEFRRVLRPGGLVLLGFHVGDRAQLKTQGYGGHPMNVYVYRRPLSRMAGWLREAGFTIESEQLLDPDDEVPAGLLFARTPDPTPAVP